MKFILVFTTMIHPESCKCAVVRHCGKGKMGVQFVNVEPSQRDHWWKIMRSDF